MASPGGITRCLHVVLIFSTFFLFSSFAGVSHARSFTIDYNNDCFLKDGEPFRYISGAMHYFRVLPSYWEDRMLKMRAAGLNTIQTYISWNMHEPQPGVYDFTGENDVVAYFKLAQSLGFTVVVRAGPYIDSERDFGGFPYWLMSQNSSIGLRSSDPAYLRYVDKWLGVLLPILKPLLYENGGPIITVAVENEYGSYAACDFNYMHHLKDVFRTYLGPTVVLFTTDGGSDYYLKCGKIDGLYATIDFGAGADVAAAFESQRNFQRRGPLVNSEFYPGWIDHWGEPHSKIDTAKVIITLNEILSYNASVTIYMFQGGTSFAFKNGANLDGNNYHPSPTSYDFDAPLSEAGDPRPKYYAIRDLISKHINIPMPYIVPPATRKFAYGTVEMNFTSTIFDALPRLRPNGPIISTYPKTFEEVFQDYGFMLYRTKIPNINIEPPSLLFVENIETRALVYVNGEMEGLLSRTERIFFTTVMVQVGDTLDIFVENQGRICYGPGLNDPKGLLSNVTLDGKVLTGWEMWPLPLNQTNILSNAVSSSLKSPKYSPNIAGFYTGTFTVPSQFANFAHPPDSYLNMQGWSHGVAFVNGFNLGRYWPVRGPQITLYVPGSVLKVGRNRLVLFETDLAPCGTVVSYCLVSLTTTPEIDGPVTLKAFPKNMQKYVGGPNEILDVL